MAAEDFKKTLKHLYAPSAKAFEVVEVPAMQFLMLDGSGDPNHAPEYQQAVETLYGVAYKLKFLSKQQLARDFVVLPLEGLWWAEDMTQFSVEDKSNWLWTMMIMQPEWITPEHLEAAREAVAKKGLARLDEVRLERYHEGLSVQILHIGSYAAEAPTLARLHGEFMPENGYLPAGKHHEIYLSNPQRVAPEKLKTVLRQPVRQA